MDAKLIYWSAAWLNMLAITLLAWTGVRRARGGDIAGHRRRMLTAAAMVGVFLASYVFKVVFLGREDLASWQPAFVTLLRVHELCVAVMIAAGLVTITLAMRLRLADARDGSRGAYPAAKIPARLAWHRRAGRTALYAAFAGLVTAGGVLVGMLESRGLV